MNSITFLQRHIVHKHRFLAQANVIAGKANHPFDKMLFDKKDKKKKEKPKETLSEAILGIAAVLVSGLFIITFIIQAFEIPSSSMEDTLLIGDHVFVDRLSAAPRSNYIAWLLPYRNIHRGEIAVFISPAQPDLHLVKRIIGVSGDRIHLVNGEVYVNGEKQAGAYIKHISAEHDPYRDEFPSVSGAGLPGVNTMWPIVMHEHMVNGELVVPPGYYFGMGDNRDISLDSRYWGFIPQENLIGRPLFIYWSFETPKEQYDKTAWSERIAFVFHVVIHFFDQTRWSRMFHPVH